MKDWGEISEIFEEIYNTGLNKELENNSEAQTRFDIIDRIIREILQWKYGQISVEPHTTGIRNGYIDYELRAGDYKIIIEAKKIGAAFPSPTKRKNLKLTGTILGKGEIGAALNQAEDYAKDRDADVVVATNGTCWCFYPLKNIVKNEVYASLLFPFKDIEDAEALFNIFSVKKVENGSLTNILTDRPIQLNNKLLNVVDNSDYRVGRNNIADYIMPAIDNAILSEALLQNEEVLKHCYVTTDSRTKFDRSLNMQLAQYRPTLIKPVEKVHRNKQKSGLSVQIEKYQPKIFYPVTLLIGSVGSGKSTYLKYFEKIQGKKTLTEQNAHWIYIDFEELGKKGDARKFIYTKLNDYLLQEHPDNSTSYKNLIEPAYEDRIKALARGPYSLLMKNREKFNEKVIEIIDKDFKEVEPYVERVLGFLASTRLCVLVIDNVDLYEDDELETTVFSEAISISKKINCNIIVSIRDTTYIKHKNDSIFNAHELKRLWINPPSFKDVLSRRLKYAKIVLKDKRAVISMQNGIKLQIDDLSQFFTIVQESLLDDKNSELLEYLSDRNPRRGITLIQNFLSSGHINADKALKKYLDENKHYSFPYHEVFKGSVLGQWKYFKENRSEAFNIFEANFGSTKLQLVRLHLLKYFHNKARINTPECSKSDIIKIFSTLGMSESIIEEILRLFITNDLIQSNNESAIEPIYSLTLCGGYYLAHLSFQLVYTEAVMFEVNIFDNEIFQNLSTLTSEIEYSRNLVDRMELRKKRMSLFMEYLLDIETAVLVNTQLKELAYVEKIKETVLLEFDEAINRTKINYGK